MGDIVNGCEYYYSLIYSLNCAPSFWERVVCGAHLYELFMFCSGHCLSVFELGNDFVVVFFEGIDTVFVSVLVFHFFARSHAHVASELIV